MKAMRILLVVWVVAACKGDAPAKGVANSDFGGILTVEGPGSEERSSARPRGLRPQDLKHQEAPIKDKVPGHNRVSHVSVPFYVGHCEMYPLSRITIANDGVGYTDVAVRSTDDDDVFQVFWDFYDAEGRLLLTLPSPGYWTHFPIPDDQTWYNKRTYERFDSAKVDIWKITKVKWTGTC